MLISIFVSLFCSLVKVTRIYHVQNKYEKDPPKVIFFIFHDLYRKGAKNIAFYYSSTLGENLLFNLLFGAFNVTM